MTNNRCNDYNSNGALTTSCCINFNDMIQINPTNKNRCKSFQASSILCSTNDNSVYSKASANFIITDTDIIATGDFSNSFAPIYSINGKRLQIGLNRTQFGGYPIKTSNTEFLIYLNYFQDVMNYNSAFVGRIILLFNGQTFMDQNNAYTSSNNCYNFTAPYYDININYNITVVSQLCCTLFSDNSAISTTTLSSKSSSTSKVSTSLLSSIMSTPTTKSFLTSTTAYTTTTSNSNNAYFFFHVFLVLSFLFGL